MIDQGSEGSFCRRGGRVGGAARDVDDGARFATTTNQRVGGTRRIQPRSRISTPIICPPRFERVSAGKRSVPRSRR